MDWVKNKILRGKLGSPTLKQTSPLKIFDFEKKTVESKEQTNVLKAENNNLKVKNDQLNTEIKNHAKDRARLIENIDRHEKLRRRCKHVCVRKLLVLRNFEIGMHTFAQKCVFF